MTRFKAVLLTGLLLICVSPAHAQFFSRKAPVKPSQRVPELILTVKTDADERKRQHAAEELREYDAATFTEIVPVLAEVLKQDKKANVRLEALNSLARIRPIHPLATPAIEKAATDDESWRVRWQAKTALTKLQVSGFVSKKAEPTTASAKRKSDEPPANPVATITVAVMPPPANTLPRPMPSGEPTSRAAPVSIPVANPAPSFNPAPTPTSPPASPGPQLFPE